MAAVSVGTAMAGNEQKQKAAKRAQARQAGATALTQEQQQAALDAAEPSRLAGERALLRLEQIASLDPRDITRDRASGRMRDLNAQLSATGNLRSGSGQDLTSAMLAASEAEARAESSALSQFVAKEGGLAGYRASQVAAGYQPQIQEGINNQSDIDMARGGAQSDMYAGIGSSIQGALMGIGDKPKPEGEPFNPNFGGDKGAGGIKPLSLNPALTAGTPRGLSMGGSIQGLAAGPKQGSLIDLYRR